MSPGVGPSFSARRRAARQPPADRRSAGLVARCSSAGLVVAIILSVQFSLLLWLSNRQSPTPYEPAHLAAGLFSWRYGRFSLYRVNPPLGRLTATLPLALAEVNLDWRSYTSDPSIRCEWSVGHDFVQANCGNIQTLVALGRCCCCWFCLVGALCCYRWARSLCGNRAGLLALIMLSLCPEILAHGSLVTADLGAAVFGVIACFSFSRWLGAPTKGNAACAGGALGIALVTKTTWLLLLPLYVLIFSLRLFANARRHGYSSLVAQVGQLILLFVIACNIVNATYLCNGSFKRLCDFDFVSELLSGGARDPALGVEGRNRFSGTWLGRLRVPLPEDYVLGVDIQKKDFELRRDAYLCGVHKHGGWWYYYLVALGLKMPLGLLAIVGIAIVLRLRQLIDCQPFPVKDELTLILPAAAVILVASAETGVNKSIRYVLPSLPFIFVWAAAVISSARVRLSVTLPRITGVLIVWAVASSLWTFPHQLAYFNELAGGPRNGHMYLIDGNIDWGQDAIFLKDWLRRHPDVGRLHLLCSAKNTSCGGIEPFEGLPEDDARARRAFSKSMTGSQSAEWYAIGVNRLHDKSGDYAWLLSQRPAAMVGYSIYIYHVPEWRIRRPRRERVIGPDGLELRATLRQRQSRKQSSTSAAE